MPYSINGFKESRTNDTSYDNVFLFAYRISLASAADWKVSF